MIQQRSIRSHVGWSRVLFQLKSSSPQKQTGKRRKLGSDTIKHCQTSPFSCFLTSMTYWQYVYVQYKTLKPTCLAQGWERCRLAPPHNRVIFGDIFSDLCVEFTVSLASLISLHWFTPQLWQCTFWFKWSSPTNLSMATLPSLGHPSEWSTLPRNELNPSARTQVPCAQYSFHDRHLIWAIPRHFKINVGRRNISLLHNVQCTS